MKNRRMSAFYFALIIVLFGISVLAFIIIPSIENASPEKITMFRSQETNKPIVTEITTPTIWIGPSWGSIATYPPATAEDMVKHLYDNPPCRFSCWWNIIPGQTKWEDAWKSLAPMVSNLGSWQFKLGVESDRPDYYGYRFFPDYTHWSDSQPDISDIEFLISRKSLVIEYIRVKAKKHTTYSLGRILMDYGKPGEIFFAGFSGQGEYASHLFMYYPDYHFLTDHFAVVKETSISNGMANVCYQETSILLWGIKINLDLSQAIMMEDPGENNLGVGYPLKQVIGIDNVAFYQNYKDKGADICLQVEGKYVNN